MKKYTLPLFVLSICCLLFTTTAYASSAKEIQTRMKKRIPAITQLKDNGVVGENNKGYLEFRKSPQQQDVVTAENSDRKTIYTAIAKKQGASAELVGQRRALSISQKGKKGYLFQDANGKWYTK